MQSPTFIASAHEPAPTLVRAVLWVAVGVSFLMAAGIGIALLAGNSGKGSAMARTFLITVAIALAIQGGYIAGPFAIGRSWWPWAFAWMTPVALMAIVVAMGPVIGAIKWTRPDGASGWKTIASMGWFTALCVAAYIAPPILMWVYRPTPRS